MMHAATLSPRTQLLINILTVCLAVGLVFVVTVLFLWTSNIPDFKPDLDTCGVLQYDTTRHRVVSDALDLASSCASVGQLPFERLGSTSDVGCVVSNGTDILVAPCDGNTLIQLNDTGTVFGVLGPANGGTGNGTLPAGFVKSPGTNLPLYTAPTVSLTSEVAGLLPMASGGTANSSIAAGFVKSFGPSSSLYSVSAISMTTDVTGLLPMANGGTGNTSIDIGIVKSFGPSQSLYSVSTLDLTTEVSGVLPATKGGLGTTSLAAGYLKSPGPGVTIISVATIPLSDTTGNLDVARGGTSGTTFTAGFLQSPGGTGAFFTSATVDVSTQVSGILPAVNGGLGTDNLAAGYLKSPGPGLTVTTVPTIPLLTDTTGTLTVARGGTGTISYTAGFVKSPGGTTAFTSSATVSLTTDVSGILPLVNGGLGHGSFATGYLVANNSDIVSVYPIPSADIVSVLVDKTLSGTTTILDVGTDALLYIDTSGVLSGVRYEFGSGFNVTTSGSNPTIIHVEVTNFTVGSDGNVTSIVPIEFGGTGQDHLDNGIVQVNLGVVSSTTAPVKYGGTGLTTYAVSDMLYASGTQVLAKLAAGTPGQVLHTNVAAPYWGAVQLASSVEVAGVLGLANGGTSFSTYAQGDMLYASATNTLAKLTIGGANKVLLSSATVPSWGQVDLTAMVTGILPAANGGTGFGTANPYTAGDMIYATGATTLARVPAGSATTNSILHYGSPPTWGAVNLTTQVSAILPVANGGTGIGSYTTGALLVASGPTTLAQLVDVALGSVLISGGVGVVPSYGKVNLSLHTSDYLNLATQVVGVLPVANGGTGVGTFTAGIVYSALGGTNPLTTLTSIDLSSALVSNTLPTSRGGTGIGGVNPYTTGSLFYASSATVMNQLPDAAINNVLVSKGVGVAPAYEKVGLTTHVSGVLGVANGGTGAPTFGAGFVISAFGGVNPLDTIPSLDLSQAYFIGRLPSALGGTGFGTGNPYTVGNLLYAETDTGLTVLAPAAAGNVLHSNGAAAPSWSQVSLTADVTGTLGVNHGGTGVATFTAGIVYSSLGGTSALTTLTSIDLSGVLVSNILPATKGGTGFGAYTVGDMLYASTTTALGKLTAVAVGKALISNGVGAAPIWGQIDLSTSIVTGTLAATKGGTGTNIYTIGDLLYGAAGNTLAKLAAVGTGKALLSKGVGTAPDWGTIDLSSSIVANVLPVARGGTGVGTFTAGFVKSPGGTGVLTTVASINLASDVTSTLGVGNGGTGITSFSNGQIPIGNGGVLTAATLTASTGITITNGPGSISIGSTSAIGGWTAGWIFREVYTGSNYPGTSTTNYMVRHLNTNYYSSSGDVTLDTTGFIFTFVTAGTYYLEASAPGYNTNGHFVLLRTFIGDSDWDYGTIEFVYADATYSQQTRSFLRTIVTATANQSFKLWHWFQQNSIGNMGPLISSGSVRRTYAEVRITRIA